MEVPRFQPQVTQENPLPNVKFNTDAPIEAFGGGQSNEQVFAAASGVGQEAERQFAFEKKKADDVATQEAYAKTVELKNRLMYDPHDGAITKKGKDALGVADAYGTQFDKQADEIEGTLNGADQVAMYKKIRSQQRLDLTGDLERHTAGEYGKFQDETYTNAIKATQDDVLLKYRPGMSEEDKGVFTDQIRNSVSLQKALIVSQAGRTGKSPEWVQAQVAEITAKTHANAITEMLNNKQDVEAQDYFNKYGDQIRDGETKSKVMKELANGTQRGTIQRKTDEIIGKSSGDLATASDLARQIIEPQIRDGVEKEVLDRSNLQKNIDEINNAKAYKSVFDKVRAGTAVKDLTPEDQIKLKPDQLKGLEDYEKKKSDQTLIKTSKPLFESLLKKLADPETRDDYAKIDYTKAYGDQLTDSHLHQLVEKAAGVLNEDSKVTDDLDGIYSRGQIIDDTIGRARLTDQDKNAVRLQVESYAAEVKRKKGELPSTGEIQKYTDDIVKKGIQSGKFTPKPIKEPKEPKPAKFDTPDNLRIINEAAGTMVLDKRKTAVENKASLDAVNLSVRNAWDTENEAGHVLTHDEIQAMVKRYAQQYTLEHKSLFGVAKDGSLLGKAADYLGSDVNKKGYEITAADVPPQHRAAIVNMMNQQGIPISDRAVTYFYVKKLDDAAQKKANRRPQGYSNDMKSLEDFKASGGQPAPVDDKGNIIDEKANRTPLGYQSDMQSILDYEEQQKIKDKSNSAPAPATKGKEFEVTGKTKDGHKIVTLKK